MVEQNIVPVGRDGRLDGISREDVATIASRIRSSPEVVIHFHGGLVDRTHGIATAERLSAIYRAAHAEPVFLVWQSGLTEVLRNNLTAIAGEPLFTRLLMRILQFTVGKIHQDDGQRAAGLLPYPKDLQVRGQLAKIGSDTEPYADLTFSSSDISELSTEERQSFEDLLAEDSEVREAVEAVLAGRGPVDDGSRGAPTATASSASLIDPEALDEIDAGAIDPGQRGFLSTVLLAKKAGTIFLRVIKRLREKSDHGVYPTVVEEILREFYLGSAGAAIWSAMKNQTANAFGPEGGARLLLDGIVAPADAAFPRITLVGHSAGGVFIDNLFAELARGETDGYRAWPPSARFRVVLLAPANSYRSFAATLAVEKRYIDELRMFTMTDTAERSDKLAGAVYPRSLLYFVSGLLERDKSGGSVVTPLTGLARYLESTYSGMDEIQGPRAYLTGKVVLSPTDSTALPGRAANALTHGAFDDDELVLNSVQEMIEGRQ